MKTIFLVFAATATLLLVVTAVFGVMVDHDRYAEHHFALGLLSTLFVCLCHCVVFTYFIATHKMIMAAVEDASLDDNLARQALGNKMRAYRMVMPATGLALLAVFSGGWASINPHRVTVHLITAGVAFLWQLVAFRQEFAAIAENGALIERVFAEHERAKAQNGPADEPSSAGSPQQDAQS